RPSDFSTIGSVVVREGTQPIRQINELEYVDGAVFANIFETWRVLKIDAASGCVLAAADLSALHARFSEADRGVIDAEGNFVLNGIAHDPKTGVFTVTGKDWPMLFTGHFIE
ncbi:MAG: glutaminyl-peptide cyclotransferase, partial [Alphaproteobacteria bacterium]|nr:glutaminyl-peptide cyclotransferase [Alphaproteobacteria bacterium]